MDDETLPLLGNQKVGKEPGKLVKLWKKVHTNFSSHNHKIQNKVTSLKAKWRAMTAYKGEEIDKEDRKKYERDLMIKKLEEEGFLPTKSQSKPEKKEA